MCCNFLFYVFYLSLLYQYIKSLQLCSSPAFYKNICSQLLFQLCACGSLALTCPANWGYNYSLAIFFQLAQLYCEVRKSIVDIPSLKPPSFQPPRTHTFVDDAISSYFSRPEYESCWIPTGISRRSPPGQFQLVWDTLQ